MHNLIRSELYKLFHSRSFWTLLIISAVTGLIIVLIFQGMMTLTAKDSGLNRMGAGQNGFQISVSGSDAADDFNISGISLMMETFSGNLYQTLILIFTSIFTAMEFSHGTVRNTVSRGLGRGRIYLAKYLCNAAASLLFTFAAMATSFAAASVLWGTGPITGSFALTLLQTILVQLLLLAAYSGVCMFIAILFRSSGGAVALNFCLLIFLPSLLSLSGIFTGGRLQLERYWLVNCASSIASPAPDVAALCTAVISGVITLLLSVFLGVFCFKKRDI